MMMNIKKQFMREFVCFIVVVITTVAVVVVVAVFRSFAFTNLHWGYSDNCFWRLAYATTSKMWRQLNEKMFHLMWLCIEKSIPSATTSPIRLYVFVYLFVVRTMNSKTHREKIPIWITHCRHTIQSEKKTEQKFQSRFNKTFIATDSRAKHEKSKYRKNVVLFSFVLNGCARE